MSVKTDLIDMLKDMGIERQRAIAAVDALFARNRFLGSGLRAVEAERKRAQHEGRKVGAWAQKVEWQLKETGTALLNERIQAARQKAAEEGPVVVDAASFVMGKLAGKNVRSATPNDMKAAAIRQAIDSADRDALGDLLDNVLGGTTE